MIITKSKATQFAFNAIDVMFDNEKSLEVKDVGQTIAKKGKKKKKTKN